MGYLSDVARRRIAAVLLVVGIAVAVLAITDSTFLFSDPPTEAERAEAAVRGLYDAAHEKRYKSVCASLTRESRTNLQVAAARVASQQGLKGCDEIFKGLFGPQLSRTRVAKIDDVRVSGNKAVVEARLRAPGSKHPQPATFDLFLVKDEWQIDLAGFGT